MKKVIIAPDSFKGSLSAQQVCEIEKKSIQSRVPGVEIITIPMADGGEGMVDAYLQAAGGGRSNITVHGPLWEPVPAFYGVLSDGTAVIEMAAAAGLPMVKGREDPLHTTTWGVGELIADAKARGACKIILGLGGSCTNDCGIGMAAALGYRFLDRTGSELEPVAENLEHIYKIEEPAEPLGLEICAACDVTNPLIGQEGATYTFGPQKGADKPMQEQLERGMVSFEQVMTRHFGRSCAQTPGAGAAGGMGAAVLMLLGGRLKPGIELLLDAADFDEQLLDADLVITGEGRIDWQSANGKVPSGVAQRCKKRAIPCLALCGSIGKGAELLYEQGVTAIFSAIRKPADFEEIKMTSPEDLEFLTDSVLRLFNNI